MNPLPVLASDLRSNRTDDKRNADDDQMQACGYRSRNMTPIGRCRPLIMPRRPYRNRVARNDNRMVSTIPAKAPENAMFTE
ncbi:hypothetical protein AS156_30870 [Bradyrhizobium macuxiense]|uniref:Uncharacterized protein n=1 Tax=Bradyrhizobium macuxiense TaxID=1755647 RepID=A0A109K2U5_9BRAD|nr:hypothetical protein AS156_30870 [Bradyrhizobium macuxiense]